MSQETIPKHVQKVKRINLSENKVDAFFFLRFALALIKMYFVFFREWAGGCSGLTLYSIHHLFQ